jgi:hypothetical protein
MAKQQRHYLDARVLTAFLIAAIPFVAFGSFVVVNMARNQLRDSVGASLEQRAVQTKLALEQYVGDQLVHLRLLALEPEVQRALAVTATPLTEAQAAEVEKAWSSRDPALTRAVLESPLADRLRTLAGVRPMLKLVQVLDTRGQVVASSVRSTRLVHSGSAWFQDIAAQEGSPELRLGDIQQPKGFSAGVLELAYPVRARDGAWVGAVRTLVDATDLYTVLAPVRVGRTGHATLLRATDGLVLASDESERILKATYPGFESLRNAMEGFPIAEHGQAIFGRPRFNRGYWTVPEVHADAKDQKTPLVEPARLVGFSPIDQVPSVSWVVAVEQDLSEALAPINSVTRYLWIHFVGLLLTVILLAVYFSFKLEQPVMQEDLHLHEEHLPAGMRPAAS